MDEARVQTLLLNLEKAGGQAKRLEMLNADRVLDEQKDVAGDLMRVCEAQMSRIEAALIPYIEALMFRAEVQYQMVLFAHHSPSLIEILTRIWDALVIVWDVISWVLKVIGVLKDLGIIDLLYEHWPDFQAVVDKLRIAASHLSHEIGWGLDGIIHIMNAANTVTGMASGLRGDHFDLMEIDAFRKLHNVTKSAAVYVHDIIENPSEWIWDQIDGLKGGNYIDFRGYSRGIDVRINEAITFIDWSLMKASSALDQIDAIRKGMPSFVAQYIPNSVWEGIDRADRLINEEIYPVVSAVKTKLNELDAYIEAQADKIKSLDDQVKKPGDLLQNVDDLGIAHRVAQEAKIDDVVSRNLERGVDTDLDAMIPDLEAFALLDEAMTAPTPEPGFLAIESPERKAVTGIVEEPRETWFVGDY